MAHSLRQDFQCSKKVEELVASHGGFHCNDCSKSVIDFRGMDKNQIIENLKKSSSHCGIIPTELLDTPTYSYKNSFWTPFRKSALLITLFIALGEVKILFAQTKAKVRDNLDGNQIPTGYQRISPTGFVFNDTGKGIADAEIVFYFDGEELGRCKTDSNGRFSYVIENFGGIVEIDMSIHASLYKPRQFKQVPILKENPNMDIKMEFEGFVIYGDRYSRGGDSYTIGETVAYASAYFSNSFNGALKFHGIPLTVLEDIYPEPSENYRYEEPIYTNKLHYPIQITDENGFPISGAKVEMFFPKNIYRWATTNDEGKTKLRIHLKDSVFFAKLIVSADGYHQKTFNDFRLDTTTTRHFILKKKRNQHSENVAEEYININEFNTSIQQTNIPADHIAIFPNPSNEAFTVQFNSAKNVTVEIVNITGKVMQRKTVFNQNTVMFDVSTWTNGAYIAIIRYDEKVFSQRILIAR